MTDRRTALVTGASRGIGLGIAHHLAASGYDVVVNAREAARLDPVAADLRKHGVEVVCHAGDMSSEADVEGLVDTVTRATGGSLHALVLGAGVGTASALAGYPLRRFDKQVAVNVRAPFMLLAAVLPMLRTGAAEQPATGAKIVALTSITGIYPEPGMSAYAATKAALISLCQSVNVEEAQNAVSACALSPAFVDTDMSAWAHDSVGPEEMITVADVVELVGALLRLSPRAVVPHLVVSRAVADPYRA